MHCVTPLAARPSGWAANPGASPIARQLQKAEHRQNALQQRNAMTSLYEVLKIVGIPIAVLLLIAAASFIARRRH